MTADGTVALGQLASGTLEGMLILATAVWTGGLVAIFVVARVARHTLMPRDRVAFFRGLGRAYGPVGGIALAMALGCGAALLYGRAWDGTLIAATVIAACLVLVTAAAWTGAGRPAGGRQNLPPGTQTPQARSRPSDRGPGHGDDGRTVGIFTSVYEKDRGWRNLVPARDTRAGRSGRREWPRPLGERCSCRTRGAAAAVCAAARPA